MKKIIVFLFLCSVSSYSQIGGESIYNFLNLAGSARQASLGGKTLTLLDDVNQASWNPAIIGDRIHNQISINYLNYLADINMTSVSFAGKLYGNNFYTGMTYLNYGNFIGADESGVETGSFKAYDLAITVGYSYKIINSNVFVGGNVKLINSAIENYSSLGIGGDIAVLYFDKDKPYAFTLGIRNIGYQVKVFDEMREKLPWQLDFGASYSLENVPITWHFTMDNLQKWKLAYSNPSNTITDIDGNESIENISFFNNAMRHFSIGAEIFPRGSFNIRLGYNFRRSKELQLVDKRTFSGFTGGFGIKMKKFKFNYAFSKFHPASNSSTFSLQINLN
jgi:hypothetical protein